MKIESTLIRRNRIIRLNARTLFSRYESTADP